jgi:hypothetical protein
MNEIEFLEKKGFKLNLSGTYCIVEFFKLNLQPPLKTMKVYSEIGRRMKCTGGSVERNIKTAISFTKYGKLTNTEALIAIQNEYIKTNKKELASTSSQ